MSATKNTGSATLADLRQRMKAAKTAGPRSVEIPVEEWLPGVVFTFREPGPVDVFNAPPIAADLRIERPAFPPGLCNSVALLAICCAAPAAGDDADTLPFFADLADAEQARAEGFEGLFWEIQKKFVSAFPTARGGSIDEEKGEAKNA